MPDSTLTIGLVTDTHFWLGARECHGADARQLQPYSEIICDRLMQNLATQSLDLAIHMGDITCGGGSFGMPDDEFDRTLDWFCCRFRALDCPVRMLPGNHDAKLGHTYHRTERLLGLPPGLGTSMSFPEVGLHVELLNAQGHDALDVARARVRGQDPVVGQVSAAELARLEQSLQAAGDLNVILCTHQLLMPMSAWSGHTGDNMFVRNRREVLDILARHGRVCGVFQGHAHVHDVQQIRLGARDCTFAVVPALGIWPVAWMKLSVDTGGMALQLHRLDMADSLVRQSREAVESSLPSGRPAWDPWRIAF